MAQRGASTFPEDHAPADVIDEEGQDPDQSILPDIRRRPAENAVGHGGYQQVRDPNQNILPANVGERQDPDGDNAPTDVGDQVRDRDTPESLMQIATSLRVAEKDYNEKRMLVQRESKEALERAIEVLSSFKDLFGGLEKFECTMRAASMAQAEENNAMLLTTTDHQGTALPARVRIVILQYLSPYGMAISELKSALLLAQSRGGACESIRDCALEAQRELEAAESLALYQFAEGAWRGTNWFEETDRKTNGHINTERDLWLARISAEPHGPVEDLIRSGPVAMQIGHRANNAGSAAWKIRKWDVYQRVRGAPLLDETHPEIVKAAEAVCDAAAALNLEAAVTIRKITAEVEQLVSTLPVTTPP